MSYFLESVAELRGEAKLDKDRDVAATSAV